MLSNYHAGDEPRIICVTNKRSSRAPGNTGKEGGTRRQMERGLDLYEDKRSVLRWIKQISRDNTPPDEGRVHTETNVSSEAQATIDLVG